MSHRTMDPECMALPLAKRSILLGSVRRGIVQVLVLVGATATTLLLVPVAFFAAAVAMVLFQSHPGRARSMRPSMDRSWWCSQPSSQSAIPSEPPAPRTSSRDGLRS